MDMEDLLPNNKPIIRFNRDGSIAQIIDQAHGKKALIRVINGKPQKAEISGIAKLDFTQADIVSLNRRAWAIIADCEKRAKLARELKKPNWTYDLERYGVIFLKDGRLLVSRWFMDQSNERKKLWQKLNDLDSAIRQQDHIMEKYLARREVLDIDPDPAPEFYSLLRQLAIVRPYIETRRELLIYAQRQMDWAVEKAIRGLEQMLAIKGGYRDNCHGLANKLKRMAFFLRNSWPSPYREKIDQVMPLIKAAEKSAAKLQWSSAKYSLETAKKILVAIIETTGRQSIMIPLSNIDPIKILAEVNQYNLADEIMALAKKYLPDHYLKYRGFIRLNYLLAVARLMIAGQTVSREEILKLHG